MEPRLEWDEAKRLANLSKHGLDFADTHRVLNSRYRLDVAPVRQGETRVLSFFYVMDHLAVLTGVHTPRDGAVRVISFRPASETESEHYHGWISGETD